MEEVKKSVSFTCDETLLERIDLHAKRNRKNRTKFIAWVLQKYVDDCLNDETIEDELTRKLMRIEKRQVEMFQLLKNSMTQINQKLENQNEQQAPSCFSQEEKTKETTSKKEAAPVSFDFDKIRENVKEETFSNS